jgi:DNA-binding phage protein
MKTEKIDTTDWEISPIDYDTNYSRILSENPKELKYFKNQTVKEYNATRNLQTYIRNLSIIAKAEGIVELAKKSKMQRPNVYRMLSKESNPTARNLFILSKNLGIDFNACIAK